ncbi:hypothetical protein VB264_21200 [Arcicella aquatica]|uniref:CRISPR type III-B/RAMP module-associated protein Cmr5 n=1 Tax=Arcicella aquatica TaxID=217141 RepID=A0ABU5QU00_9BACT|nr:type III-B CRISPR module-associated protein Cmr5 [Arcicella aquatica]MEA5260330.1 hypothetical protein [Arcicella aquatica]
MKKEIIINNMDKAYTGIEASFAKNKKEEILKEYNGYAASFCTTLRQLGLMAALLNYFEADLYYHPKQSNSKLEKPSGHHLIDVLAKMFGKDDTMNFIQDVFESAKKTDKADYKKKEKLAAEYAITIKKTLRLFKLQS